MEQLKTLTSLCIDDLIFLKYRIKKNKTKLKSDCHLNHILDLIETTIKDIKLYRANKVDNIKDIIKQLEAISFAVEAHKPTSFINLINYTKLKNTLNEDIQKLF